MAVTAFLPALGSFAHLYATKDRRRRIACNDVNVASNLLRRTTPIGRFSGLSQTPASLSQPSFFLLLTGSSPLTPSELAGRLDGLVRSDGSKYWRLSCGVTPDWSNFVLPSREGEGSLSSVIRPTFHPTAPVGRIEVLETMSNFLTTPLPPPPPSSPSPYPKQLQALLSSGVLGASGVLPPAALEKAREEGRDWETIVYLRSHHVLADGVSLAGILSDVSDQREEIREQVRAAVKERKQKRSNSRLSNLLKRLIKSLAWLVGGMIVAGIEHIKTVLSTRHSPFLLPSSSSSSSRHGPPLPGRALSYVTGLDLEEVKSIARSHGVTINDLIVHSVSQAVSSLPTHNPKSSSTKVLLPVHLTGGVVLDGSSLGNRIGGVSVCVSSGDTPSDTARKLSKVKAGPMVLLSHVGARVASAVLPGSLGPRALEIAAGNAAVAVTNVRGPSDTLTLGGRKIESVLGFVPPPTGVPIGVVVSSMAGEMAITVNADPIVVRDPDLFLGNIVGNVYRLRK